MKRTPTVIVLAFLAAIVFSASSPTAPTRASRRPSSPKLGHIVIGYFPSWNRAAFDHTMISYGSLTHVANAFAWPDAEGNLVLPEGFVYPELIRTAHLNGVKVIMSLGGADSGAGFAPMAADSAKRARFIGQVTAFCYAQAYDGVDIDWEFPETPEERTDFTLFAKELSTALRAMKAPRQLTMAVSADAYYGRWIEYEILHPYFDYIGFMTYDFHGPWSDHAGHNAPLYSCDGDECGSWNDSFLYARSRGVPLAKLLLGIPFYGRSFDCNRLYETFQVSNYYPFYEVMALRQYGWPSFWDRCAKVPCLRRRGGGEILSYDDEASVWYKCRYVRDRGAAGVIIWEISLDRWQGKPHLLDVVKNAFMRK
jgi:chitinase